MASHWIVKRRDKEQGPFTSQQLKKLADSGQLRTTDWVRKHDSDQFVKAEKVKGLFDNPPVKDSEQNRGKTKPQEMLVAGVVEVMDNDPPSKGEPIAESYENDFEDYDDGDEDFAADDFDDYDDSDETPSRRSTLRGSGLKTTRSRGGANRRQLSPSKPKNSKARKKKSSDDEDEDGQP